MIWQRPHKTQADVSPAGLQCVAQPPCQSSIHAYQVEALVTAQGMLLTLGQVHLPSPEVVPTTVMSGHRPLMGGPPPPGLVFEKELLGLLLQTRKDTSGEACFYILSCPFCDLEVP